MSVYEHMLGTIRQLLRELRAKNRRAARLKDEYRRLIDQQADAKRMRSVIKRVYNLLNFSLLNEFGCKAREILKEEINTWEEA